MAGAAIAPREAGRSRLLLTCKCSPHGEQLLLPLGVDFRVSEIELLHCFHCCCCDDEPSEPFVVGRHDVPWRRLGRSSSDSFFESVHVVAPITPLVHVRTREFPVLLRIVEALQEPLLLLCARYMQEELQDDSPLPGEVVLEVSDVGEPLVPNALAHQMGRKPLPLQDVLVHTHNENLLVIGPVEDSYPPTLRQALVITPQKVVAEVLLRWLFERENLTALWIYSRHDVPDSTVFASRIHRLENEQ